MSDERKELLDWIDEFFYTFSSYHPKRSLFKKGMADKAYQQIRQLIQQKFVSMFEVVTKKDIEEAYEKTKQRLQQQPEIDEKWLENKTFEMIDIVSRGNILESMRFIKSIISDVRGGKT